VVEDQVTYVNAPLLASERGVEVALTTNARLGRPREPGHRARRPARRAVVTVSGTHQSTPREALKLTELDGFALELDAVGVLLFFRYVDRPGVVGTVGSILGDAGVNIAAMQVARREAGGEALMTLTVDGPVAPDLLDRAAGAIGATAASTVDLTVE
jgi:D-3-phosphoglycerate dehydrogenase